MDNTSNSLFDTDALEKRLAQLKIDGKPRVAEYPARPEDCFIGTFHDEDKEQPWYGFDQLPAMKAWEDAQHYKRMKYFMSATPPPVDKWGNIIPQVLLEEVYDQSLLQELVDYTPKCPIPTDEEQCQQSTTAYYAPRWPYNDYKPGVSYYLDKVKKGTTYWIDMSALAPKGDIRMSDLTMASAMGLVLVKSRQYGRSRQKGGDKI